MSAYSCAKPPFDAPFERPSGAGLFAPIAESKCDQFTAVRSRAQLSSRKSAARLPDLGVRRGMAMMANDPRSPGRSWPRGDEPDDSQMTRWMCCVLASALLLAGGASLAQEPAPVRVRGTIEAVDGATLTVRSRDRQMVYRIKVADDAVVRGIVLASLAEIKNDAFVGVSGLPQADGSQKALEVHIFPEAMRGTGEGHGPWDLVPDSTMTNATVAQRVKGVEGEVITLKYKGGEKKVVVLPQTRIVTFVPGDKRELEPGAKIFVAGARRLADGTLEARSIAVGRDGMAPPM